MAVCDVELCALANHESVTLAAEGGICLSMESECGDGVGEGYARSLLGVAVESGVFGIIALTTLQTVACIDGKSSLLP